ncbi:AraC family transcriptional regulator [Neptunomonas concharum]|uniref:AraC family transcriptional regulator n=1 Tax=Neptunomonas concharum TaxID=1031538 RepID=UPI00147684BB|nr:helix-turn-helix domain-containing protein [Neptunomonas concharum]
MDAGKLRHQTRINDVLYHIHSDISAPLNAKDLAKVAAYSTYHFHRVFKEVTGENLNDYIRRSRLERAANLLIYEPSSNVLEVASRCGFLSHASFTHAFKKQFGSSPREWRNGGYSHYKQAHSDVKRRDIEALGEELKLPAVTIRHIKAWRVAYVRHQGYDRSICEAWGLLQQWALKHCIDFQRAQMLGLHPSNPDIVPLDRCRYLACIEVDETVWRQGKVGVMMIPSGMHAVIEASGRLGDLLPVLHAFYHRWLPQSGYQLGQTPAYAIYRRNQFLDENEIFELEYAVPIVAV